jgi:hypothetical protein
MSREELSKLDLLAALAAESPAEAVSVEAALSGFSDRLWFSCEV